MAEAAHFLFPLRHDAADDQDGIDVDSLTKVQIYVPQVLRCAAARLVSKLVAAHCKLLHVSSTAAWHMLA